MTQKQVYDALTIADEILKIAKRAGKQVTPMKLMKLTYIAHGWSLALLDRDLFRNRIEAWQYGPVIPDLYHATKTYGRNPIPLERIDVDNPPAVDSEVSKFLTDVWAKYGHLDAIALSNLTHMSGTPWERVFRHGVRSIEITDDLIREHYKELARERRAT